jgi:hypothetical protein
LGIVFSAPAIVEHGTAVIAINYPNDWAVVAADSLFSKDDPSVPATLGCKIRNYGKFTVAVSGLYGRPGSSFDVWESFKKASARSNSMMEFTKVAEADIEPGLVWVFLDIRRRHPDRWKTLLGGENGVPLQYVVIALETSGPTMVEREFDYTEKVMTAGGDGAPNLSAITRFTMLGVNDHMDPDSVKMQNLSPVQRAIAAMQVEIDNHPTDVSAPISVLVIDKSGVHWVDKGACNWEPHN